MTPESIAILRASERDAMLAKQAFDEVHGITPFEETALGVFLRDPSCYLLLAVQRDRVLGSLYGYALTRPNRPEPQFLLYEMDVRAEYHNQGIGKMLVRRFIEEARAVNAWEVWVVTNESNGPAMKMYQDCGLLRENPDDVMLAINLLNE